METRTCTYILMCTCARTHINTHTHKAIDFEK